MVNSKEQEKITSEIEHFIEYFVDKIQQGNAAIFAGAGLSVAAGFVNWHELLSPIMKKLDLNPKIEKETDLVTIAQYYCNTNNRADLNELIINKLSDCPEPTDNHKILARLPIDTYWTTNYDKLIEKALEHVGKISEVKYTTGQLIDAKKMCNAVVYKMHGDVDHAYEAILTKDDYDQYYIERGKFIDLFTCDLMSKTFLFIGFSFTDPNIDYVLSRVRAVFNKNQRKHYCFLKNRLKQDDESEDEFKNAKIKQELAIEDLKKRFNIVTLLIDDYSDITKILERIELQFRQRTIFISGSAEEYGDNWTKQKAEEFLCDLSRNLIKKDFRIVTGFGLGVGDFIIVGAVKEIYSNKGRIEDSLIIRPFPQETSNKEELLRFCEDYRQESISTAGICLVVFGNKKDNNKTVFLNEKKYNGSNCETDLSSGVQREFEIAKEKGLKIVPIGATGYMAEKIWKEVMSNFDKYYPNSNQDLKEKFNKLKDREQPSELINSTLEFIASITNH